MLRSFSRIFVNKDHPARTKLDLHKTSIRPVLLYAFPIWFSISPVIITEMEILERIVLRHR